MIFIEVGFIGRRHSHPARLILRGQIESTIRMKNKMDQKEKGKEYYKYGERWGGEGERTTRKEQKRERQNNFSEKIQKKYKKG